MACVGNDFIYLSTQGFTKYAFNEISGDLVEAGYASSGFYAMDGRSALLNYAQKSFFSKPVKISDTTAGTNGFICFDYASERFCYLLNFDKLQIMP